ncbi:MAG: glycosyltransferase [Bacteroidales bacterium]|nr:glycosyltransferase [Bacteroidales bacterium]
MSDLSVILLISPEPWDGHFVSKHHYAVTLADKGHKVYFLDPPDPSLVEVQIKETKHDNLWSVSAPQVAKGLRFYPKILRNFAERRWLKKLEDQIRQKFTTVWLFENSRFYDMDFAGDRLKIYHQVDLNQNFHVKEAVSSADICFCTTDFIQRDLMPFSDKVYKIHHGVTLPMKTITLSGEQSAYFKHSEVNVVSVGNLDISFLDIELLLSLIKKFPQVTFHLVGSYSKKGKLFEACVGLENIVWWGRVESNVIPAILSKCDISLLIYKAENQYDKEQLASPHKMMEYLSSGKVTVATYTDEYKDKRYLLEMVNDSKEYEADFEKVVKNLDFYNSNEKQQHRIEFAQNNSYGKQLEKIVSLLKQNSGEGF